MGSSTVHFLEETPKLDRQVSQAGFSILPRANAKDSFKSVDAGQMEAFLALHEDGSSNLEHCRLARDKGIRNVVAYVVDPDLLPQFNALNVQAYTPAVKRITLITMMARSPDAFSLLSSHEDKNDTVEIDLKNRAMMDRPVRDLSLPGNCLVLAIRRNEELLVPRGNTELRPGDRITLFGSKECLGDIRQWLESRDAKRPDFLGKGPRA